MTEVIATETAPRAEKPKLFRHQLTEHFRIHGLPPYSLPYINKISSQGDGPPYSMIWSRRPLYDPDDVLIWMRARVEEQTQAARARTEHNRKIRQMTAGR